MPKERKDRSVSHEKLKASPLYCESSRDLKKPSEKEVKEWEEARCPVCMEHPHNGILLICSSFDKGCRPYMCDTSHRHSNCFDQYRKASKQTQTVSENGVGLESREEVVSEVTVREDEREVEEEEKTKPKLTCPLCRGHIKEWVAVEDARGFMNAKLRTCSSESCEFSGTYSDLRKHARLKHPGVRPSEADPERQRSWRRLERQRDLGDLLSTLQSSFGGEERSSNENDGILSFDDGGWLTVFFLIRVFRPESSRSSSWSGTSRARSHIGVRRRSSRLWGESYEGGDTGTSSRDEENNQSSDEHESRRRVRRRAFIADDDDDEEEP
ncbi:unnamed protein product [Eruca vesicaria subsp. sativa]|uniref:Uncharacterized protein n=1 Tax=Eruca vesicaria subsp. sativa TaxID=29727 RepID=A0ABC8KPZ9_ERUVS|nr:unnamed protein product [Eruca vesicaria subsp. sativa]